MNDKNVSTDPIIITAHRISMVSFTLLALIWTSTLVYMAIVPTNYDHPTWVASAILNSFKILGTIVAGSITLTLGRLLVHRMNKGKKQ